MPAADSLAEIADDPAVRAKLKKFAEKAESVGVVVLVRPSACEEDDRRPLSGRVKVGIDGCGGVHGHNGECDAVTSTVVLNGGANGGVAKMTTAATGCNLKPGAFGRPPTRTGKHRGITERAERSWC